MRKTNFQKFKLKSFLTEALENERLFNPTEIQERLIPTILNGRSAIGQSHTGTGKTLAYLLPIINELNEHSEESEAIITAPTRELADQIYREIYKFLPKEPHRFRIMKIVGGTDRRRMTEKLKMNPHIIVGTPGRIADLVRNNELTIFHAKTLVIDEADLMLEMGFIEDVDYIAASMQKQLQMLIFSATIPKQLYPFLDKYMDRPKKVQIESNEQTTDAIEHLLLARRHHDRDDLLVQVARVIHPFLALVFANTQIRVDAIFKRMRQEGFQVERIHGGLTPRERKRTMGRVARLECQYIVATDLAARGIDIEGVSHVINSELPDDLDFYIHRVGRTGRAGLTGTAITLYDHDNERAIADLIRKGITFKTVDLKNNELIESGRTFKVNDHRPKKKRRRNRKMRRNRK